MGILIGMPAYPTLQELRTAGWTLEQICRTYGVDERQIQATLASHFLHVAEGGRPVAFDAPVRQRPAMPEPARLAAQPGFSAR